MKNIFFLLVIGGLLFSACGDDDSLSADEQKAIDIELIENYLIENGLAADTVLASGVHAIIEEPGTGTEHPNAASTVIANYKGYLLDGTVFDQNNATSFPLNGVIQGWQQGIPLFKKDGKGVLLIPSALAYGANPPSSVIPKNAVLVFDIELLAF